MENVNTHFREVCSEALISRHPKLYTAFKVTIYEIGFKKVIESSIYPENVALAVLNTYEAEVD